MNAPAIWILFPILLGCILTLLRSQRLITLIAGITCTLLALAAILIPIDTLLVIREFTFKLSPIFEVLGRRLTLDNSHRSLLALLYAAAAFWFSAASAHRMTRQLVPLGLIITALLVAALAVEPFLYAALIIETAVLLAVPLLAPQDKGPGKGVLYFLVFQTLAMPFILFSGWLLTGVEANPGDVTLITRATALLGLGFAFLLAIFPFYVWIPLLSEEAHPFIIGYILWIFPTISLFFGLSFLERYAWLRTAASLPPTFITVGSLMIFMGGLLALFNRHLGRMLGYAVMAETGFSLLAIGLGGTFGMNTFLLLLIPRVMGLGLWSFSLSSIQESVPDLTLQAVKGMARVWPFSSTGIILASLSLAGVPILASFPAHQAIWNALVTDSLSALVLVFTGSLGLTIAAIRVMIALASSPEGSAWGVRESWSQRTFLVLGCVFVFLLGLIPAGSALLWEKLPSLFAHLGQ